MNLTTLALIVGAGLLGPVLAAVPRIRTPLVVGEILAGVLIGRSGFDWVPTDDPTLKLLSEIGFALLMLIVGTHLPIRQAALRPALRRASGAAFLGCGLAIGGGYLLAPLCGLHRPLVLAVLLATSSAAVALPVLQSLPRIDDAVLVATAWIAIADVATVVAIPLVIRQGSLASVVLGIVLVVVSAAGIYLVARVMHGRRFTRALREQSWRAHWALDLRLSLVALFLLAALATRQHTSVLISGFAAGVVLALLGEPRRLGEQLIGVGEGFLVPLFFVSLGAKLDLSALVRDPGNLRLAGLLVVGATAVHVGAGALLRLPLGTGLLATAQLGVPSAIATLGLATGTLTPGQAAAVLAAALLSLLVCASGSLLLGPSAPIGDRIAVNGGRDRGRAPVPTPR